MTEIREYIPRDAAVWPLPRRIREADGIPDELSRAPVDGDTCVVERDAVPLKTGVMNHDAGPEAFFDPGVRGSVTFEWRSGRWVLVRADGARAARRTERAGVIP